MASIAKESPETINDNRATVPGNRGTFGEQAPCFVPCFSNSNFSGNFQPVQLVNQTCWVGHDFDNSVMTHLDLGKTRRRVPAR